jgi:hypothetical protein
VRVVLGVATPLIAAIGRLRSSTREAFSPGIDEACGRACGARTAVLALAITGPACLAWAFAALVVVNTALTTIWRQRWYA